MEQDALKWCLWCGDTLPAWNRRRKFCSPRHMIAHQNSIYRDKLVERFNSSDDLLTDAQFSLIAKVVV